MSPELEAMGAAVGVLELVVRADADVLPARVVQPDREIDVGGLAGGRLATVGARLGNGRPRE
jgi:hypothetical protein